MIKLLAKILSHPRVANWLIRWAESRMPCMSYFQGTTGWWFLPKFLLKRNTDEYVTLMPRQCVPAIFIIKHTKGDDDYAQLEKLHIYTVVLKGRYATKEKIHDEIITTIYKPGDIHHAVPKIPRKMLLYPPIYDKTVWEIGIFKNLTLADF